VLSDWIAIFFMMKVHSKNYSAKSQEKGVEVEEIYQDEADHFSQVPTKLHSASSHGSQYSLNSDADFNTDQKKPSDMAISQPKILSLQSK
jgi:hypothetical protein